MKKIILALIILLILFILPLLGIFLIIFYLIYIMHQKNRQRSSKKFLKNNIKNIKLFIENIFTKNFSKIYFENKIEVYRLDKYIIALKQGIRWYFIVVLKINKSEIGDLNLPLEGVYFMKGLNINAVIIKESFFSFKLSSSLIKAKVSSLANKIEIINSYLSSRGIESELVEANALLW